MRNSFALRSRGVAIIGAALALGLSVGTARAVRADDKAVAQVNGEAITMTDFMARLQRIRGQDFIASYNPLQIRTESAGMLVMNSMINETLILQLSAKEKVSPTDADIADEWDTLKVQASVKDALAKHIVTEAELKRDLLVQMARFKLVTKGTVVTPEEVQTYYDMHKADYTTPEIWGLSAIRTSQEADIPKIQSALKLGTPFVDVVKTYSEDERTKAQGGDLGKISAEDPALPESIRTAVKGLKIGDVTSPIPIDFDAGPEKGKVKVYWFVRLNFETPKSVTPFDQVKTQVRRLAMVAKAGPTSADSRIKDFRLKSAIKIDLPGYESLLNPPSSAGAK